MKIIITGSSGFIGYNLLKYFTNKDTEIICLIRKNSHLHPEFKNIKYHYVNYNDTSSIYSPEIFKNADYIFHCAGVTKGNSKKCFRQGNVIPTKNILEAIKQNNIKLKRFILLSSIAACGPSKNLENPITEKDEPHPIEYYGKSKLEAEKITLSYKNDIPITIIRPASVYGPQDKDFLNLFQMINKNINIFAGNKNKYTSIIHVDDLIEGIVKAALNENCIGQTYNLSNNSPVTWQEIHSEIISSLNSKPKITLNIPYIFLYILGIFGSIYSFITKKISIINIQKIKLSKPKYFTCSNQKAISDFNFSTSINLEEGIKSTCEWYKQNKWL
jgi:dihydroflavonol-4-reductase